MIKLIIDIEGESSLSDSYTDIKFPSDLSDFHSDIEDNTQNLSAQRIIDTIDESEFEEVKEKPLKTKNSKASLTKNITLKSRMESIKPPGKIV